MCVCVCVCVIVLLIISSQSEDEIWTFFQKIDYNSDGYIDWVSRLKLSYSIVLQHAQ